MRVVILGTTGMLGHMVERVFTESRHNVKSLTRNELDALNVTTPDLKKLIGNADYVINCIGIIKPYIKDDPEGIKEAYRVNGFFPYQLASAVDSKIIQIATDCVYTGQTGGYKEHFVRDAADTYGASKNRGEAPQENIHHLRCSIIGPEVKSPASLMEWFLGQPKDAQVNGFTNHLWNGLTTLHFARICKGIVDRNLALPNMQHVVPADIVSKAELLEYMAEIFDRQDITIEPVEAEQAVNRTLDTDQPITNKLLWRAAGYRKPPTIKQMLKELREYN